MASGLTLDLLYFARIAELTGKRSETWPCESPIQGDALLTALTTQYPSLLQARQLRLAVNQVHVKATTLISPGDEVGIFEPVTGG